MAGLTAKQRELVVRMRDEYGIHPDTTRSRIKSGWPEGRLHEQPVSDPKRNAATRRYTEAMRPKKNHAWRKWNGPEHLNAENTK